MSTAARRWTAPAWGDAGLVSGEAVHLDVRAARIGSRVLALSLDVLLQLVFALLLTVLVGLALAALPYGVVDAAMERALFTIALVVLLVGYPVLFERLNHGRTPGKAAVGLQVVSVDGAPVGFRQSLTRALVGVAVEWPGLVLPLLSWVAGVTVMLTDARGRRLGDLVAGTLVVHTRAATRWRPIPATVPELAGWAYTLDLSRLDPDLALAARQYLARAHQFAEPIRGDLARRLWREVATVTTPPPPAPPTGRPGLPASAYLAAVLGERHRRARHRLAGERGLATALWPQLAATPPGTRPDAPPGTRSDAEAGAPPDPTVRTRADAAVPAQAGPGVRRPAGADAHTAPVAGVDATPGRP
ncbi:RDD family protein [Micromonospora sp. WMMD1082]|uniref:RDD family protein n=1 Tax=Micromonospora sp. WMMD1082 TaxID=3016104 RepID=UPI002416C1F9|nr:RDD family protein [Micromonospora sp. WMMD1082]MDG4793174.1 RDD family protein [Micromonospora sp. WMMD1082]